MDGIGCGDLIIPKIWCYFYVNAPIYFFILLESSSIYTRFTGGKVEYVILPEENKISYADDIRLVSEKRVTHMFGHGSISPLVILPSIEKKGGFNSESIKMSRKVFVKILQELGVEFLDASSVIGF